MVNMGKPFVGLICGHTSSRKSYFFLRLLEKEFKNYFDHIYIFAPTFYFDETYLKWKHLKDKHICPIDCEQEEFEDFVETAIKENNQENTLLVLDDLAATKTIKKQTSILTWLANSGRHHNLSLLVLTQQYTSCAKAVRDQIAWVVTFFFLRMNMIWMCFRINT